MTGHFSRIGWCVFLLIFSVVGARADVAADLARVHTEAIGGREKIEALSALRATGVTRIAGQELKFVLWAQRPNRVRIETEGEGKTLVRAYDGEGDAWRDDPDSAPKDMVAAEEREFVADSDFDDLLFDYQARKISLDYAGEAEVDGRTLQRILVTRRFSEVFWVYLDDKYMIVRRDAARRARGRDVIVQTHYSDFRTVAGVLLPHRIQTKIGDRLLHETEMDRIQPNPLIPSGFFRRPAE